MTRSIARWTTAVAAAAIMAMPAAGLAQTQPPPPSNPNPTVPPEMQQSLDQDAAKQHLTAARNSLSELTQHPAAAQLTGEARTHVSELISNFNEMITTDTQWRAAYSKLEANLVALLGPEDAASPAAPPATGTPGAVGTSGVTELDPEIRAKLVEFRNHLQKFEQAAGGATAGMPAGSDPDPQAPATGQTHQTTPGHPHHEAGQTDREELVRHIDAIEAILGIQAAASMTQGTPGAPGTPPASGTTPDPRSTTTPTTGTPTGSTPPQTTPGAVGTSGTTPSILTLDQAQLEQLRHHLSELRRLVNQR